MPEKIVRRAAGAPPGLALATVVVMLQSGAPDLVCSFLRSAGVNLTGKLNIGDLRIKGFIKDDRGPFCKVDA